MNSRILALLIVLTIAAPLAASTHDAPLWAKSADYATPSETTTQIWYDDTRPRYDRRPTQYVYHDVYHPPRVWYVHRNDNFYRTNAGTSSHRSYRSARYARGYDAVYHGDGFSRYY